MTELADNTESTVRYKLERLSAIELESWLADRLTGQSFDLLGDVRQGERAYFQVGQAFERLAPARQELVSNILSNYVRDLLFARETQWQGPAAHNLLLLVQRTQNRPICRDIVVRLSERLDSDHVAPPSEPLSIDLHYRLLQTLVVLRWRGTADFWRSQLAFDPVRLAGVVFTGMSLISPVLAVELLPQLDWGNRTVENQILTRLPGFIRNSENESLTPLFVSALEKMPLGPRRRLTEFLTKDGIGYGIPQIWNTRAVELYQTTNSASGALIYGTTGIALLAAICGAIPVLSAAAAFVLTIAWQVFVVLQALVLFTFWTHPKVRTEQDEMTLKFATHLVTFKCTPALVSLLLATVFIAPTVADQKRIAVTGLALVVLPLLFAEFVKRQRERLTPFGGVPLSHELLNRRIVASHVSWMLLCVPVIVTSLLTAILHLVGIDNTRMTIASALSGGICAAVVTGLIRPDFSGMSTSGWAAVRYVAGSGALLLSVIGLGVFGFLGGKTPGGFVVAWTVLQGLFGLVDALATLQRSTRWGSALIGVYYSACLLIVPAVWLEEWQSDFNLALPGIGALTILGVLQSVRAGVIAVWTRWMPYGTPRALPAEVSRQEMRVLGGITIRQPRADLVATLKRLGIADPHPFIAVMVRKKLLEEVQGSGDLEVTPHALQLLGRR